MTKSTFQTAQKAYGDSLPKWIADLAKHIDAVGNQRKVADAVGYSPAAISALIHNKYKAPLNGIEQAVNAYLNMGVTNARNFRHTNPIMVRLARYRRKQTTKT